MAELVEHAASGFADAVRQEGGQVLRDGPDGWLARYDGPGRAARAAVAVAAMARGLRLGAAQGLHVGEVEAGAAAAAGTAAQVAEAVARAARPGETLASALVGEVAAGSGLMFAPRGEIAVEAPVRRIAVVALAAEAHLEPAPRRSGGVDLSRLSRREREVLELVAEGSSNPAIAARLDLSEHTVKRHMANILTKLDLPSRAAAAALAARAPG